ncbi:MAG: transposase [Hungatella sp.]|nr:transposase [Hungatella sp.]
MPVSDAAKQLDIHYNSLYRWIHEYEDYEESAFPGHGCALYNYQYKINKLKSENKHLFVPHYFDALCDPRQVYIARLPKSADT